jgi:hypothetical protein
MDPVPFGLSIHHFISSVGADAGFASLIGLALLVLLYFAHARETATLRARADEAGLRVQELEAQLADLTDQVAALPAEISVRAASPRAAAAYAGVQQRVPAGVPASAGMIAGGLPPAAPAGVGAPALAAATRLIPDPQPPLIQPEPATTAGANGASHAPAAASAAAMQRVIGAPAGAPPRPGSGALRVGGGQGRPGGGPGRAGAAPGRGAGGPVRAGTPGRAAGGGQPRPVGGYPGSGSAQSRPSVAQSRSGTPPRAGMPLRPPPRRSRTGRVLAAVLVVAVAVAAVVAGVVLISNRNSSSTTSKSSASASLASHRTRSATAVVPSTVTVSVLNGTNTLGLAGRVAAKLIGAGYRKGAVANASDSTHATTIVAYKTAADRRDALAVAASLKLAPSKVQLLDSATQGIACTASPLGCNSAVVVTVGNDLAGL